MKGKCEIMIVKPTVTELLKRAANRYELVIATARRARQIAAGAEPKTNVKEESPVTLAANEIAEGKVSIEEENEKIKVSIENLKAPENTKEKLRLEMKRYEQLPPMSPELGVIKTYIEWFLSLPWNEYTEDETDLKEVRKRLDASHAGLVKVKERIIEYLAVNQMTNSLNGPIICLVGPPGVGKTTLAISIAKAIHKNFVKF